MSAKGPVAFEVRDLVYHYPDGSPALSGVSLAAAPGERLALLGPNGAGKSTLLLHLAALLPEPHRYLHTHGGHGHAHRHGAGGEVFLDGEKVGQGSTRRVRDRVGIVFEDPDDQLIGLSVGEDVGYGPRSRRWSAEEVDRAVREALAGVGLTGFEERSPHHLSSGERRRVCLAGALACRPGLLLLDEPSSGLDPRGRRELAELLLRLPATLVIASHDLEFVRKVCGRAAVVDGGRIVAEGATAGILDDGELLARHGLA